MSHELLPPSVQALLRQGALFEGKYELLEPLGEGSFATVLHARHEAMEREVALKFLRPDVLKAHPEVSQRFMTEVRLASGLSNAHTVTIFDFGRTEEGIPFMVLEYVDGRTLDYTMERYGSLGKRRSIRIALQILDSLAEAHAHNIIHRDLKPANIMIGKGLKGEDGRRQIHTKVLDFGVAKLVDQAEEGLRTTESGRQSTQFIGTPRYMSPEQILGQEVSPASDLYSLGLIFYEMCTGLPCVEEGNVARVAQAHLSDEPLPLPGLESLPQVLQKIILRATHREADERFQSAKEFQKALQAAVRKGKKRSRQARTAAAADKSTDQAGEAEEHPSDVFSGRSYLSVPEVDDSQEDFPSPGSQQHQLRPPTPGGEKLPSRPSSKPRGGSTNRPTSSAHPGPSRPGELDLDLETIQRQKHEQAQRRRRSLEGHDRSVGSGAEVMLWFRSVGFLLFTTFVAFVIVGGALDMLAFPMRVAMALLPTALALLWAVFSPRAYRDRLRRIVIPWSKRSLAMVVIALFLLALVMPDAAGRSLRNDALWFMVGWPEAVRVSWFSVLIEGICEGAAWLLERVAQLIPWSG